MASEQKRIADSPVIRLITRNTDVLLSASVIMMLALMIIPLPSFLLDILLAANFTLAVIILMVSMYVTHPLELSVFPGLLLIITIFRLSLNVASTRLILGEAYAGEVISAFGSFVVQGNYVVGFIIFIILVIIQFVVIVKGAGRIAEVSARFTLDAMPGKQMAIDADMNAGLITEQEARERRAAIGREAEFYGAMDGASKFVKGDAIAGLLINLVNLLGGFIIGVVQKGLSISDSLHTYSLLTVGDGLVSQIPALIISTAAGMLVTRNASGRPLDQEMRTQVFSNPKGLLVVA
ncbi:MAG: flagellar biosynthesis protein FlhA, partial [Ignavibacteria bacterium]|nr:flagellar biosynthesis protein FlhA [Ignavibacteria bacterium]